MADVNLSADVIDVRDVIERVKDLRCERDNYREQAEVSENPEDAHDAECAREEEWGETDEGQELATLESILAELRGYGGDEQFEGEWYPITLIRDSYFQDYAQELAEDTGMIRDDAAWPYTCIDWEKAARELQMDYSSVEIEGATYWYR